ncbi:hypothetical protein DFH06DRAFT_1324984 [Mycena polygramma]|nr:hypothetical protein DFH06DRAFT_1324984 [Mycena polygramma]
MSESNAVIANTITSFDVSLLASSSRLVADKALADYLPSVRAVLLWNLFRGLSQQTEGLKTMLEQDDGVVSGDTQRQEILRPVIRSIAEKIRQLSVYVDANRAMDLQLLARIRFHDAWAQDTTLAIFRECRGWSHMRYSIFLRFLRESAGVATPYEFDAMCNTIAVEGGPLQRMSAAPSTAVKQSCERLFTDLVATNIGMLRRTASAHHIDVALGYLLSISHRESYHSTSLMEVIGIYLTQRNSAAGLCAFFDRYRVNLLWPRIASRMKKCVPTFEDIYVKAIWELASVASRCLQDTRPQRAVYRADFEFWALTAISKNTTAYASTTILVKLNILSALHHQHFEGPLAVQHLLKHPLISTTSDLKDATLAFPSDGIRDDDLGLFRAACVVAHITALTDFLAACSSQVLPYKAAETLACIAFPEFPPITDFNRHPQIELARAVQRLVHSQMAGQESSNTFISPLVAMLRRSIVNVLTDLSARCTIMDAIVELEEFSSEPFGKAEEEAASHFVLPIDSSELRRKG